MKLLFFPLATLLLVTPACSHRGRGKEKMTEASSQSFSPAASTTDPVAHDSFASIAQDTQNTLQTFLTDTEAAGGPKTEVDQALVATATEALKSSPEDKAEIFADKELADVAKDVEGAMDDEKDGKKSSNSDLKTATVGGFSVGALVGVLGVIGTKVAYDRAKREWAATGEPKMNAMIMHKLRGNNVQEQPWSQAVKRGLYTKNSDGQLVATQKGYLIFEVRDFLDAKKFPDLPLVSHGTLADKLVVDGVFQEITAHQTGDGIYEAEGKFYRLTDPKQWKNESLAFHQLQSEELSQLQPPSRAKYYAAAAGFGSLAIASTVAAALTGLGYMPGFKLSEDTTDPTSKCLHSLTELAARITALRKAQGLPTISALQN